MSRMGIRWFLILSRIMSLAELWRSWSEGRYSSLDQIFNPHSTFQTEIQLYTYSQYLSASPSDFLSSDLYAEVADPDCRRDVYRRIYYPVLDP